ncbi:MAG TPA: alternative ribosome rescue aminoacyl-tRNA hydrolase ArfB [Vicinamibacterales bacterium]|nr:alternative ribosome rescue aminoacyl-tRNA hydrolase ArfB [Vicinamibacterales bacterium]
MIQVTADIAIPESEISERFVRASGPGGQNVNKVSTAVELRFDPSQSSAITSEVRDRLRVIAGSRMTADGVLVIDARRHRTQAQNREDARERLADLLRQALVKPRRRRATRPGKGAVERRIEVKKRRSDTKRARGRIGDE